MNAGPSSITVGTIAGTTPPGAVPAGIGVATPGTVDMAGAARMAGTVGTALTRVTRMADIIPEAANPATALLARGRLSAILAAASHRQAILQAAVNRLREILQAVDRAVVNRAAARETSAECSQGARGAVFNLHNSNDGRLTCRPFCRPRDGGETPRISPLQIRRAERCTPSGMRR